jgi:translation initiation factor IF-3
VLDQDGKQIGIMNLSEALTKARNIGLDVVEITQKAKPPVVKIVDFKKFKYEEARKERVAKKKTKESQTKEIWIGPLIDKHDLETRLRQSQDFFKNGDRVKFTVKFTGRQMTHRELGYQVLEKVEAALSEIAEKDGESRFIGRRLSQPFKPRK